MGKGLGYDFPGYMTYTWEKFRERNDFIQVLINARNNSKKGH